MTAMANMTRRSPDEKQRLLKEISAMIKAGVNTHEACKQVGVGVGSYYAWQNKPKFKAKIKRKYTRKPKVEQFEIPPAVVGNKLVLLIGTPIDVVAAAKGILQ